MKKAILKQLEGIETINFKRLRKRQPYCFFDDYAPYSFTEFQKQMQLLNQFLKLHRYNKVRIIPALLVVKE